MTNPIARDVNDVTAACRGFDARRRLARLVTANGVVTSGLPPASNHDVASAIRSIHHRGGLLPTHAQASGGLDLPRRRVVAFWIADVVRTIMDALVQQACVVPHRYVHSRAFSIPGLSGPGRSIVESQRNVVTSHSAEVPSVFGLRHSGSVNAGDVHADSYGDIVFNLTHRIIGSPARVPTGVTGDISRADDNAGESTPGLSCGGGLRSRFHDAGRLRADHWHETVFAAGMPPVTGDSALMPPIGCGARTLTGTNAMRV